LVVDLGGVGCGEGGGVNRDFALLRDSEKHS
jgi:hypothetical protein